MGRVVLVEAEVDIEDYLSDVSTPALIRELKSRDTPEARINPTRADFADDRAARKYLFDFMGIPEWKGRGDLVTAILELFQL